MDSIAVFTVTLFLLASVHGGTHRFVRQSGWGSGSPPSSGWNAPNTSIGEEGASEAIGYGTALAEHSTHITLNGSVDVPAILSISSGSGVGLYQSASNYQQSNINSDGSSNAYQGNTGANSGYAYDYLGGDLQGVNVDVQTSGWSAVEGEGAVGQADAIAHQGPSQTSAGGWTPSRKP